MRLCLAVAGLLLMAAAPAPTRLQARAPGGRALTLLATRGKQAWVVTVVQTGQRITAEAEGETLPDGPPRLMPLASPAVDDLLLPVALGNVNSVWDVWLQDARSGRLTEAGQLSGIEVVRDRSGAIVTLARGSCCEWAYSVWRIGPDRRLDDTYDIDVPLDQSGRAAECRPTGVKAGVRPDPALVARYCRKGQQF